MKKQWIFLIIILGLTQYVFAQTAVFSKKFIKLEASAASIHSANDTVMLNLSSGGTTKLVTSAPFELSVNGSTYFDTLNLTPNTSASYTIYIRSLFTQPNLSARGVILVLNNGNILDEKVNVLGTSILENEAISMCTWNIKWMGLPSQCFCDTALVKQHVTAILKEIDADVFALQEVANADFLLDIAASLASNYDVLIADYCSQIQDPSTMGYASCQKLAFLYKKNRLSILGSYGLLRSTYPAQTSTNSPYYYFASGRWPFVFSGKINNSNDIIHFVNIHAKAFAGNSEHNRRAGGAKTMTDSLNAFFPNGKIVVMGDYNDMVEGAITNGFTNSPYDYMFNQGFTAITKPSLFPGQKTYASSSGNIIDNFVFSTAAHNDYIANSTFILQELEDAIDNYSTTTTDHFPVLSHIKINKQTGIKEQLPLFKLIQSVHKELYIKLPMTNIANAKLTIRNITGQVLFEKKYRHQSYIRESFSSWQSGIYLVSIVFDKQIQTQKWHIH